MISKCWSFLTIFTNWDVRFSRQEEYFVDAGFDSEQYPGDIAITNIKAKRGQQISILLILLIIYLFFFLIQL